jgi:predicted nuclease with RNAse H fold
VQRSWLGIDLGARRVDAVVLAGGEVRAVRAFDACDLDGIVALADGAAQIAIDAPAELSTAAHRDDETVNRKFRVARCGEIALGEQARIWVPWVTPADPDAVPGWMRVGFALWAALREDGHEPLEVYPAGAFRVLAGGPVPRKTTVAGREARRDLLASEVDLPVGANRWGHDTLDALAAAVTARQWSQGRARRYGHEAPGCDPSAVWLPAAADART